MKRKNLQLVENTPLFTKSTLRQLHDGAITTLDKDIQLWIRQGILIQLKRGLYTLGEFIKREKNIDLFMEYAANRLVQPSYVSCEYVLQKYSMLTEAVFGVTSVTVKSSRSFQNKVGRFKFYSISPRLFTGFIEKPYGNNTILEATKAKALFDYLYLQQHAFKDCSANEMEEMRLNLDELTSIDWRELKRYFKLCGKKKMFSIYNLLKKIS